MKQATILSTLERKRYLSWMDAPKPDLLRIHNVPEILYTTNKTMFKCDGLRSIFPSFPRFEIGLENITFIDANSKRFTSSLSHVEGYFVSGIHFEIELTTVLRIKLPRNAVSVKCMSKWWNSSEDFTVFKTFKTMDLKQPTFINVEDKELNESSEAFFVGEYNRRLACVVEGEPKPHIRWYFNSTDALEQFSELKLSSGATGESYLEFPKILEKHIDILSGEYTCVATNKVGSIERKYSLFISEPPSPVTQIQESRDTSNYGVIYASTGITGISIVLGLCVALVVYVRRYRRTKSMLRNLTEKEVGDFFDGNPNLVGNNPSADVVDFLPYKKNYEIPLKDLSFVFSDQNLLGSGEFAFVIRGQIVSSRKQVAIKISKTSADVTLFKSMLSEVKIMTYIGQHENVVSLVGVCTEEIRSRSIYIATEICELGSLKSFLVKSKPHFVDLAKEHQTIDVNLIPKSKSGYQHVTTLDLISFAGQVAKGMEYLAYKSIIHADLATRNVLLTAEKTAKISDFGLSKRLYESTNYVKKSRTPLPWRWMALESLETLTFSTKSDVWAYGVTLYEIFTLGNAPFPSENWSHEFVARLKDGMRMGCPEYSTQEIYSKIVACWESVPEHRPDFGTLRAFFELYYEKHCAFLTNEPEDGLTENDDFLSLEFKDNTHVTTCPHRYVNSDENPENIPIHSYNNLVL